MIVDVEVKVFELGGLECQTCRRVGYAGVTARGGHGGMETLRLLEGRPRDWCTVHKHSTHISVTAAVPQETVTLRWLIDRPGRWVQCWSDPILAVVSG